MRILVLDDDQILGRAIGRMLAGHAVVVESDPDRALARVASGDWFDLVLCDLNMPYKRGTEVLDTMRFAYGVDATLVLMSGADDFPETTSADVCVLKPFPSNVLRGLVALSYERQAQQQRTTV